MTQEQIEKLSKMGKGMLIIRKNQKSTPEDEKAYIEQLLKDREAATAVQAQAEAAKPDEVKQAEAAQAAAEAEAAAAAVIAEVAPDLMGEDALKKLQAEAKAAKERVKAINAAIKQAKKTSKAAADAWPLKGVQVMFIPAKADAEVVGTIAGKSRDVRSNLILIRIKYNTVDEAGAQKVITCYKNAFNDELVLIDPTDEQTKLFDEIVAENLVSKETFVRIPDRLSRAELNKRIENCKTKLEKYFQMSAELDEREAKEKAEAGNVTPEVNA